MKMNKPQKDLNFQIIRFLLEKGANYKQLTLTNKSCEELLKQHCNKEEIMALLTEYEQRVPVCKVELKPIKKIDVNFFKIDNLKWSQFLYSIRNSETSTIVYTGTGMWGINVTSRKICLKYYY